MVKGREIGGLGGGWFEHPRQWLGAQRAGLAPWERRAVQSRLVRPGDVPVPSLGPAKGGHLALLGRRLRRGSSPRWDRSGG